MVRYKSAAAVIGATCFVWSSALGATLKPPSVRPTVDYRTASCPHECLVYNTEGGCTKGCVYRRTTTTAATAATDTTTTTSSVINRRRFLRPNSAAAAAAATTNTTAVTTTTTSPRRECSGNGQCGSEWMVENLVGGTKGQPIFNCRCYDGRLLLLVPSTNRCVAPYYYVTLRTTHGSRLTAHGSRLTTHTSGWTGPDCSQRLCPSSVAWFDAPTKTNKAHAPHTECSGFGDCDRMTGLCKCRRGFTGNACQVRSVRPSVRPLSIGAEPSRPSVQPVSVGSAGVRRFSRCPSCPS